MTIGPFNIPTTVRASAATLAALAWPLMMATEVNPSPIQVAGITAVALLAVKALTDIAAKLVKRSAPSSPLQSPHNGELRDMMLREFGTIRARLDIIDAEVKVNRERYHDLAGVLSTVAAEMKLVLDGRIRPIRRD